MEETNEMELSDIFYVIAKRKMMIIVITLVCTLVSAVVSFFIISPTYQSQTSVIVDKKANGANTQYSNNDVTMYQNLVKTYASIGESDDVYIKAAQKLNNGISSDELAKNITITPITSTQLLTVTATGGTAKEALDSVTAVTDSFIEVSNSVYPAGDIRTVNKGKLPKAPAKPNKKLNIAIGFFLGLMISAGLAFVMDYMDNTVESVEDIKRNFDLPIIGTIPLEQEN